MRCNSCHSEAPAGSRFCPSCAAPLEASASATPTRTHAVTSAVRSDTAPARFLPGAMLAGRYRIVGLLGRGGMGEVYRADDLKLGSPVALKFLPEGLERDENRLQRFLNEVRVALRVTHPNVCRVHDIGEVDGQHYLSMEYVDGEDLATLLRRIGRLPEDKALEVARQLCAGVAAAHEQGILHRDLKPANVMIDGRGRVRITDFGLAGLAEAFEGAEVRAGTPAYMAPEQRAGKDVTVRSDVYSLGLVLYELFTGRHAFDSGAVERRHRDSRDSTPATPSDIVGGLDPAVERVILRCLERDPALRPASALAVSAALPGGDPLAAALAAGETPSPELVAAAGERGVLERRIGWTLAAAGLGLFALALIVGKDNLLSAHVPLDRSPPVLEDRAREVLRTLGHEPPVVDTAAGIDIDNAVLSWIRDNDRTADRWQRLRSGRPAVLRYWHRQSPRLMLPSPGFSVVQYNDPPLELAGMTRVVLDFQGRLLALDAAPPAFDESGPAADAPDWGALLDAAGLEPQLLTPSSPRWNPRMTTDARAAWEATLPEAPGTTFRVEAAAYRGRPVYFRLLGPWDPPPSTEAPAQPLLARLSQALGLLILIGVAVGAALLARRNLKLGRGDRAGATKLALVFLVVHVIVWALWVDHTLSLGTEWNMITMDTGYSMFLAATVWVCYLALEPLVRRRWPDALVSWSRLLAGRFRDPLVGRDFLIGSVAGSAGFLLIVLGELAPGWLGHPPARPLGGNFQDLFGARWYLADLLDAPVHAVIQAMQGLFLIVVLRIVLRKQWLAVAAFVLLFTPVVSQGADYPWIRMAFGSIAVLIMASVLVRYGLLALTVGVVYLRFLPNAVLTADLSAWYAGSTITAILAVVLLVAYGLHTSLGGSPRS